MSKWIAEFELEDGDTMPEHMDLKYEGAKIDFHCRPMWIPVSEKLPEEDKDVLITYRYKEGEGDMNHSYIDITSYGDVCFGGSTCNFKEWHAPFQYFHSNYEVIAWTPLPEPYKEEKDERNNY